MGGRGRFDDAQWKMLVLAPIMVAEAAQETVEDDGAAPGLAALAVRPAIELGHRFGADVPLLSAVATDVMKRFGREGGRAYRAAWPSAEQAALAATESAARVLRDVATADEQRAYRRWLTSIVRHIRGAVGHAGDAGYELAPRAPDTLLEHIERAYAERSPGAQTIESIMTNVPANAPSLERVSVILAFVFLLGMGKAIPGLFVPVLVLLVLVVGLWKS